MLSIDHEFSEILQSHRSIEVGILLFPEVEVLDFAGPFEVFSVASRVAQRDLAFQTSPFRVSTVADTPVVAARHGMKVIPTFLFEDAPRFNVLIVPGGVMTEPMDNPRTFEWLRYSSSSAQLTASVCTGVFLLAKLDLLEGRSATTHWEDIPDLRASFPDLRVVEDRPFVDEGSIITSAGISAGIDMSLHIVERILGAAISEGTARQMQYVRCGFGQHG